ncbi:MAG: hypothetical protein GXY51_12750 [Bacteroidetes bacterium]|nr:hypothetical protein [Bacteroidota bacterium]
MNLILTFDYELFGDGSGDVFTHVIEPTNRILSICDEYRIKCTFFFEVMEYIKLKEEWDRGNKMGYSTSPVEAIKNQLENIALMGNDIQLHVHPQWFNARYINSKWDLDFNNWRLGDFYSGCSYSINNLLCDVKGELEKLVTQVLPEYRCKALRAGGYNIFPSENVYTAMKELGMKIDSSVYPGGFEEGPLSRFDYRNVPVDLDYWWGDETDIRKASKINKEILEVPVFALPVVRWRKYFNISRIKSFLNNRNTKMSYVVKEKISKTTLTEKIKFLLQKEAFPWDVCMFSKSLHSHYFNYIEKNLLGSRNSFVLIGHPKSLQNEKYFKNFIEMAISRERLFKFITLNELHAEIT